MIDENKLLECMMEIKGIAASQQNRLTMAEIKNYMSGMELEEKQFQAIYQYLTANQITIEGYEAPSTVTVPSHTNPSEYDTNKSRKNSTDTKSSKKKSTSKAARNLALYRHEVSSLKSHSVAETISLWKTYLSGNTSSQEDLIHEQLPTVIRIAETYKKRGVSLDDIIAEGNMGMLIALQRIRENTCDYLKDAEPDLEHIHAEIEGQIHLSIREMIDSSTEAKDWESTILAKTNLLHQAAKYLAEENGHIATQEELAEYTRIPLEEIRDILELSDDTKQISKSV